MQVKATIAQAKHLQPAPVLVVEVDTATPLLFPPLPHSMPNLMLSISQ